MRYLHRLFDSINDVDLADWQRIRSQRGDSIFMDPRLIAAVEIGMKESCSFWHVIIYDERLRPIARASLTAITVDLLTLVDPRLPSVIRHLPGLRSILGNLKILLCGLPVSCGQNNLELMSPHDSPRILAALNEVISSLASENKINLIGYKEFEKDDLEWANPLSDLGYRRIESLPMHFFKPSFPDLRHYCEALRSTYRTDITASMQKCERMGIKISILTDPSEIVRVYTPEVHDLYRQTRAKSNHKFESLSVEFFLEMTTRLPGQVDLVILSKMSKIVAFGWCLRDASTYYVLYVGVDYKLNYEADLYFNIMYALLDLSLQRGVSKIYFGQTSNVFKTKLGCYSEPLYVFMKGLGPFMSPFVRYAAASVLIAQEPAAPPFNVFKRKAVEI
jgi:hypothetical protein